MSLIAERFEGVLEPYLGHSVAGMVLRGAAAGIGKTPEDLDWEDLPAFEETLRGLLEPVMSAETVNEALKEAERRASL